MDIEREEEKAAEEAGDIGGPGSGLDPLTEAGEGEAEGFEVAEADLQNNAENAERYPERKLGASESEDIEGKERSGAEYGEADSAQSQHDE